MESSAEALVPAIPAGGQVLLLLSDALKASILRLLARGPLLVPELQRHLGTTSRTARFSRLRELEEMGTIVREKEGGCPPSTHCMLSGAGSELLRVVRLLRRWSREKPDGTAVHGELLGAPETKALALGWNSTAIRWLSERPHSLTDLVSKAPSQTSYHEIRRAREALAEAGLIQPSPSEDRRKPYTTTDWAHGAWRPLAAALRWERAFLADSATPPTPVEVEALLLLLAPAITSLPRGFDGDCLLRVDEFGSVSLLVRDGKVVSCVAGDVEARSSELSGSLAAWLDVLVEGRLTAIQAQGRKGPTAAIANGLREACS